jgi:cation transport protein ChaC
MLTRESILNGAIYDMLTQAQEDWRILSDEEMAESRNAVLTMLEPGADVWVFAYGSLIWNPAFHFAERQIGTAHGFHRRYCLWSHIGRGTKDNPGLMLGLDNGGSCRGVAYRIAPEEVESELDVLWLREMVGGAYVPRWLKVRTDDGPLRAIGFTINHEHPRYAGRLPAETIAGTIAGAAGPLGPCAEYLLNTVDHLEELGITDRRLACLRDRVVELGGGTDA